MCPLWLREERLPAVSYLSMLGCCDCVILFSVMVPLVSVLLLLVFETDEAVSLNTLSLQLFLNLSDSSRSFCFVFCFFI